MLSFQVSLLLVFETLFFRIVSACLRAIVKVTGDCLDNCSTPNLFLS